jgi:hypothetical protein
MRKQKKSIHGSVFNEIGNISKKLYKDIEDKNIKFDTVDDIKKVEMLFEYTLKELIALIDNINVDEMMLKTIKVSVIIDLHCRFTENNNIDLAIFIDNLSDYNKSKFEWAQDNLDLS